MKIGVGTSRHRFFILLQMSSTIKAHLALFTVALIYGGNYSIAKVVLDGEYLQPLPFIVLRAGCGMLLFWIFHTLFVHERLARKDLLRVIICGAFGVAINQTFFFSGLKYTTPINASLIMTMTPILVLIISALLLGERINLRKIVGIILGAIGAILLISYGKVIEFLPKQWLGNILVFTNAMSYGLYLVLVKSLMSRYHPITIVKWVFTFGFLMVLPLGGTGLINAEWATFSPLVWLSIAYVLIGTTFLAYLLNAVALTQVNASVVSIYIYLQPVMAGAIALAWGKESLDWVKVVSALLIFTGVYLVSIRRK